MDRRQEANWDRLMSGQNADYGGKYYGDTSNVGCLKLPSMHDSNAAGRNLGVGRSQVYEIHQDGWLIRNVPRYSEISLKTPDQA
jgi:hypothetical protein